MFSISRYSKSPLQRMVHLAHPRSYVRPLILHTVHYSKSKDSQGDKTPIQEKTPKKAKGSDDDKTPRLEKAPKKAKGSDDDKQPPDAKAGGPPKIEMLIKPASYHNLTYEEINARLGRQLSPHLSIYKIQLTSAMSIMLRISGFVLGMGFWGIGLVGLLCNMDINELATKIEEIELSKTCLTILKFIIIMPFAYHMVVGTRHLIFYLNLFLSKRGIYVSGYVALALTLILAATLAGINLEELKDNTETKKKPAKVSHEVLLDNDTELKEDFNDIELKEDFNEE